nr:MAG TPA: hypothetical protein [Bacteriophage sp.]
MLPVFYDCFIVFLQRYGVGRVISLPNHVVLRKPSKTHYVFG